MPRGLRLLVLLAVAAAIGAAAGRTAPGELVIPYLSGGAGVYLDEDGRPVTSEGAPGTPGIHVRPAPPAAPVPTTPVPPPAETPVQPVQPLPPPSPTPIPIPAPIPAPPPSGYQRPDLVAAVALANVTSVFCRTDASWPTDASLVNATGFWTWGGTVITMRTWRCDGIAQEKIGTEAFARGLFVLAHEASHAAGFADECEADKHALETMGAITARLGWGAAVGDAAGRQVNQILSANPPPAPYCIGRLP
jgi:hypothetical protein